MGIFDSIKDLGKNVVDIAKAPVEIAVDVAVGLTDPLADAANEVVDGVKELTKDDD